MYSLSATTTATVISVPGSQYNVLTRNDQQPTKEQLRCVATLLNKAATNTASNNFHIVAAPTGSGKTWIATAALHTLMAASSRPYIVFLVAPTRQVSEQLFDAVRHLNQPGVSVVMLMGRERMCAHEPVNSKPYCQQSDACKVALGRKTNDVDHGDVAPCPYIKGAGKHTCWSSGTFSEAGVMYGPPSLADIETLSRNVHACAYYGQVMAVHSAISRRQNLVICGTMNLMADLAALKTRWVSGLHQHQGIAECVHAIAG